jgi:hypothetical protein
MPKYGRLVDRDLGPCLRSPAATGGRCFFVPLPDIEGML